MVDLYRCGISPECDIPQEPHYWAYSTTHAGAVDAAGELASHLDHEDILDLDGDPVTQWIVDAHAERVTAPCCSVCGVAGELTPWPTVHGCDRDTALLCPSCRAQMTDECGCSLAVSEECGCVPEGRDDGYPPSLAEVGMR